MSNTIWEKENISELIKRILDDVVYINNPRHHFGHPFINAYQLAIAFEQQYPNIVHQLPYHEEIGGQGTNSRNSLAQYLAKQISAHIKSGEIVDIEGAFLDCTDINISFNSTSPSANQFSIFRSTKVISGGDANE